MKKGQLFSHAYTYIFMVIVIALIFAFGFYVVNKTIETGENVELQNFIINLDEEVDSVYNLDFRSESVINLRVPGEMGEVCFVDRNLITQSGDIFTTEISDIVGSFRSSNVFMAKKNRELYEPISIDRISLDVSPLCVRTLDGALKVKLVSDTDSVRVEKLLP
jgi:hypothetical protein